MKKQVGFKLCFVLLVGVIFSLTATAATTLTQEVLLGFDGTLSGGTYTLGAGEVDTSGTLIGYNNPTVAGGTLTTGLTSRNQGMRIDTPGVITVDTSFIIEVVADIDWSAQTANATFADALGNLEIRYHTSDQLEFTHWSNTTGGRSIFTALPSAGMHHYAAVWTADGAGGTGVGSLYIDGVLIGSTSGGGMRQDSARAGWAAFSRFQDRGAQNSVFDAAALSTFTGTFDPSADLQIANTAILIAPEGLTVDPVTATSLQWDAPPSFTPTGYDLVFRADDANFLDTANNIIEITDQTAASPTAISLANDTTYFWRVDAYEPNTVGTMVPIRHEGLVWSFTTVPPDAIVLTDPTGGLVDLGANFDLTVTAAYADQYQWYLNGSLILGANSATYSITGMTVADEGDYYCVASNSGNSSSDTSETAQVMAKRLMGWWKLDGDLTDSVATEVAGAVAHDGSSVDAPVFTGDAVNGNALELTGDPNTAVTIASSSDYFNFYPDGLTVSAWMKSTTPAFAGDGAQLWEGCIGKEADGKGFFIGHWGQRAVSTMRQTYSNLYAVADPNAASGRWHMVTGTYDGTTANIYVDGVLKNSVDTGGTAGTNPGDLVLGALGKSTDGTIGGTLTGSLDDVRIYNYALDETAVESLYETTSGEQACLNGNPEYDWAGEDGVGINFRDCVVDIYDLAALTSTWLESGF